LQSSQKYPISENYDLIAVVTKMSCFWIFIGLQPSSQSSQKYLTF